LIKKGFRSRVYATPATRDLCSLMLADSGKVQEEDVRYLKKILSRRTPGRGRPRKEPLRIPEPLYTQREAAHAMSYFRPVPYGQRFRVTHDTYVTFYDAGHILGAGVILIEVKLSQGTLRLGYAVDLGRARLPLLNDPTVLPDLDYLVLESTYGGREHGPISEAKEKLRATILRTVVRGGKVLIPAFALERTQEVIFCLSELQEEGLIPKIPIFVDSPLATKVTDVFRHYTHIMDPAVRERIHKDTSPFDFKNLHYVQSQEESKTLNSDKRPMIILAGSGMCEAGRILHHLKNNITEKRNTVLVVGYMAKDTLGKRIVDRERIVKIYGMEYELNAEVVVINSLSGHADRPALVDYARACAPRKGIFLVHGDEEQTRSLQEALGTAGMIALMPEKGESATLAVGE
jgi:metallo-beta-lactamase family protein